MDLKILNLVFRFGISCNPHAPMASGTDIHLLIPMVAKGAGRQLYWILIQILLTCIMRFWGAWVGKDSFTVK